MITRRPALLLFAALVSAGGASWADSGRASAASQGAPAVCHVTHPNGDEPGKHGRGAISVNIGEKATFVATDGPEPGLKGTMLAQHNRDGTVYAKLLWLRTKRAYGRFRITGLELTKPSLHVRPDVDPNLLESPYVPSDIVFPRPGCYRITARAGRGRLRFVIKVEDHTAAAQRPSASSESGRRQ